MKGGDTTVNVGIPNKPYINGFRTIVDRTEGWTYYIFLALYDESGGSGFESAYKYPAFVLRMQCELGESPESGNTIQYAFGTWSESLWNQDGTDWDDTQARLDLEGLEWKDLIIQPTKFVESKQYDDNGYLETIIYDCVKWNAHNGDVLVFPVSITKIQTSYTGLKDDKIENVTSYILSTPNDPRTISNEYKYAQSKTYDWILDNFIGQYYITK